MVADGFGAEPEALGDFGVGVVLGDELQDFLLALGELGELLGKYRGARMAEVLG